MCSGENLLEFDTEEPAISLLADPIVSKLMLRGPKTHNFEHMGSEVLLVCYSGCKSMLTLCCQNGIFSPLFNGVVHNLFDVATELTFF